ncbi:hypothetical protein [Aestuariibacter sp. A3R04]|uniref:hypothetical protein n=1 Tax=Aestuariibacter sp. A3R04 TaxID=2841571 RepID=UPI001C099BA9|nr:hypothetical protein [Aestuariibacter sp. A3R04]MBU3022877.1 hypothetical protein [Aestuariibacter sp. A3R04]
MKKVPLTREFKDALKPALWGNAEKTVFDEIETGAAGLYLTESGGLLVVLRREVATLVVVAVVGSNLKSERDEIFRFATANGYKNIRFHTRAPEHLKKGLYGLPVRLLRVENRTFGADEYVYTLELF